MYFYLMHAEYQTVTLCFLDFIYWVATSNLIIAAIANWLGPDLFKVFGLMQ